MPRIRFLKKQEILKTNRPHDFIPVIKTNKNENDEEIVLADDENSTFGNASIKGNVVLNENYADNIDNLTEKLNNDEENDFLQVKRRDVFNVLTEATVKVIFF